jgi:hypothetical protein
VGALLGASRCLRHPICSAAIAALTLLSGMIVAVGMYETLSERKT